MVEKILIWLTAFAFSLFIWWMLIQLIGRREFLTALAVIAFYGFMIAVFYHGQEG